MFTKSLQNIIEEIIGKTFNTLKFHLLGPDRVSKAFVFSMRGSKYEPKSTIAGAYLEANLQHSHDPKSIDKKTIQSLTDVAEEYISNLEQKTNADLDRIVSQYMAEINLKAKLNGTSHREALLSDEGQGIIKKMKSELKAQKEKIDKAVEVITEYERYKAYNHGAVDGILSAAKAVGQADPIVFKQVVEDERTCEKCVKLWTFNGGYVPKLYKLSELSATPGPDRKNPLPSIEPSHINCRCLVLTLLPGFGLSDAGHIVYKGIDPATNKPWDEYAYQRNIKE